MPGPFALLLAPVLTELVKNGLGMLAGAIEAKGKEVIEEKIGVKIPDRAEDFTESKLSELTQAQMDHEEFLVNAALEEKRLEIQAEQHGQTQVTDRWKFDMSSDSWLSKNIRPLALIFLLLLLLGMVIADGAGARFQDRISALVELCLSIVLSAYFVGRTVEKAASIWKNGKK